MKEQEWLNSLKVGDEVFVKHNGFGGTNLSKGTVAKITPKRRDITVKTSSYEMVFDSFGRKKDRQAFSTSWYSIVQIDEDTLTLQKHQILKNKVTNAIEMLLSSLKKDEVETEDLRDLLISIKETEWFKGSLK